MSFGESRSHVFAAAELLDVEMSQLIEYVESSRCADGSFDASSITDVDKLSKSQSDRLTSRLR